jgi:thiosulfate dehydrogenase [quinone] large subunit
MAGYYAICDVIMMAGMFFIGAALLLGIGMKIAVAAGITMFALFYMASLPISDNPIVDYHIVYIFALLAIYMGKGSDCIGLGKRWRELPVVKRHPILE